MKTTLPNFFFVFSFPDGFPTCSKAKLFRLAPQHSQWLPSLRSTMPKLDCLDSNKDLSNPIWTSAMCETSLFEILFTNTTLVSFIIVHTLGSHQCVYLPFEPGFVQMSSQLFTLGLTQFTHYNACSPGPGCMPTPCADTSQVPRPTLRCRRGT